MTTPAPTFSQAQAASSGEGQIQYLEAVDLLGSVGFADAFPQPVKIKVDGKEYELAPLTNDDYAPWLAEIWDVLKKQRQETLGTLNANALERWKIATNIEETELTPDDFMAYILRPKWCKKVAMKVLTKGGMTEEQATAFLQKRPTKANEMFAVYFSGLYTIHYFNAMYQRVTADQPKTFGSVGGSRPLAVPAPSSDSPANSEVPATSPSTELESKNSPDEALVA